MINMNELPRAKGRKPIVPSDSSIGYDGGGYDCGTALPTNHEDE
jgi:hypothetical protein